MILAGALLVQPTFASDTTAASPPTLDWAVQYGTSDYERTYGVSADALGNVFVSGYTYGSLGGTNAGNADVFVSKFDQSGTLHWTKQLGTSTTDYGHGVSADGLGNVYITGSTRGSLEGTNAGGDDAFVSKFNGNGDHLWTTQHGTSSFDIGRDISADGLGNVYITGDTQGDLGGPNAGGRDAFVSKFDEDGDHLWTKQLGTDRLDYGNGVSADRLGNVYISGHTRGSLGGASAGNRDAFVTKFDSNGTLLWSNQIGTIGRDDSWGVSADGLGNVFISGYTNGAFEGTNAGELDAFVGKFDESGNHLWTRQLGTSGLDLSWGPAADGIGNVYIFGVTEGSLGATNDEFADAFMSKFDEDGNLLWTQQLGASSHVTSYGGATDGLGNVYISGFTDGVLAGTNAGRWDPILAKYSDPVPEPSSLLLGAMAVVGLLFQRRRSS